MKKLIYKIMLINIIFIVMMNYLSVITIANTTQIVVTIRDNVNNKTQTLENAQIINNEIMVPMEDTLKMMGIEMNLKEGSSEYHGYCNKAEIVVDIENEIYSIDGVPIELEQNGYKTGETNMIPLYFISKIYGVEVSVDGNEGTKINSNTNMHTSIISVNSIANSSDIEWTEEEMNKKLEDYETRNVIRADRLIEENTFMKKKDSDEEMDSENYNCKCNIVRDTENTNFGDVLQLQTKKDLERSYDLKLTRETISEFNPIDKDNKIPNVGLISFWGRATQISEGEDYAYVTMDLRNSANEYRAKAFELGNNWKKYYFPITNATTNFDKGSVFSIRIGFKKQTIQIHDLEVVKYTINTDEITPSELYKIMDPTDLSKYKGMEEDALWREEALKRIEKYRKNDITVTVKDKNGENIENANVDIKMNKNEFRFGSAVNDGTFAWGSTNLNISADEYKNAFKEMKFNTIGGINAFKWRSGSSQETREKISNFAKENDLYLRGHCLMWENTDFIPAEDENGTKIDWSKYKYSDENLRAELYDIIDTRIRDMILKNPTVKEWDVLNEPIDNRYFRKDLGYGYSLLARYFTKAREAANEVDENIKLYINETDIKGDNSVISKLRVKNIIDIINKIKEAAGDTEKPVIDGVGIQNHVGSKPIYPQELYNQIDEILGKTGVSEASITEYDFRGASSKELKAQYLKDMLIISYSHPKIAGFTLWGFYKDLKGYGNYFSEEEKDAYLSLIKEWTTNESGTTDENGTYNIRGHKGTYTVIAEYKGKTVSQDFTLSDDKKEIELVLDMEKEITLTSDKYTIKNEYISNIEENTNVETLLSNLETNGAIEIYNQNNEKIEGQEKIGTGMKLRLNDEKEYKLVVAGDLNGDGKVSITDLSKMKLHLIRKQVLENEYEKAIDMNNDGKYSITDLSIIKKYIVNK